MKKLMRFFYILAMAAAIALTTGCEQYFEELQTPVGLIAEMSLEEIAAAADVALEDIEDMDVCAMVEELSEFINCDVLLLVLSNLCEAALAAKEEEVVCNIEEMLNELEEFMARFGDTISLFYRNIENDFIFSHNGDTVFFGASATKAPYALYIFQKAEDGRTNLNTRLTYTEADFWEGSGIIRHRYEEGATFTQRRLLHLMIAPSDNIATRILRRQHGLAGYRQFMESIGANPHFVQNLTYSYLSANEAGIIMGAIYDFITSGGTYGPELKSDLMSNRYPFIISDYPLASKSGWAASFGGAYHDMAIVFADSPYILAILSNKDGTIADRRIYENISMFFQEFNNRWFVETD